MNEHEKMKEVIDEILKEEWDHHDIIKETLFCLFETRPSAWKKYNS